MKQGTKSFSSLPSFIWSGPVPCHLALHIYITFWKGDTSSVGSWNNRASEEDQSDQSELAPISITLAEFNRIFPDCLKNPRPCLRNQPQKVPVWSPTGASTCMKSTVLLWLLSPSPETVFTAKIFKNDYWIWMLKLKHLEKIILFFSSEGEQAFSQQQSCVK